MSNVQLSAIKRIDPKTIGLLAVVAISLLFQAVLHGYSGGDRATTPDTPRYFEVAVQIQDALQGEGLLYGDDLRTPGYPLFLVIAAESSGIDLSEVELPTRDWAGTNAEGRELVRRVIQMQTTLGVLIPVLLYLVALTLGASPVLGGLVSLAYYSDMRSVVFQFVLLNETLSIFLMLAVFLTFLFAINSGDKRGLYGWMVASAVLSSCMIIVRPPLAVFFVVLCATALVLHWFRGTEWKRAVFPLAAFVAISAILPVWWSVVNYAGTGHFFFSKNASITLQNFAARRFVQMEIDDPELTVLQRHAAHQLELSAGRGERDAETYAFTRAFEDVGQELGVEDYMYLFELAGRANRMAILAYPGEFLREGWKGWSRSWFGPFENIKNRYALQRLSEFGLPGKVVRFTGHMLLGPATLFVLVVLVPVVAFRLSLETRIWILSMVSFAILYSIAVTLADENEPVRHTMQMRVIVNGLILAAGWLTASHFLGREAKGPSG